MKVTLQTEEQLIINLDIVFYKTKLADRRHVLSGKNGKLGKELIDTHCEVFSDGRTIAHTVAYQNPKDNYNKIVGRKIALAKAIKELPFLAWRSSVGDRINNFRRRMRKEIWQVFKETFMKQLISVV